MANPESVEISIILPAKNEATSLKELLPILRAEYPSAEIIVVNDGSTDETSLICNEHQIKCISHPYPIGNGAAIKSGARAANRETLVFMDADGQHDPKDIKKLLDELDKGFDMVIGARSRSSQASLGRLVGNTIYNKLASWVTNQKISDLTSGFRAVRANKFHKFLYLLPNGFSYPTTITMSFFRSGYSITYIPINTGKRIGKSHIRPIHDMLRFFIIIFRVGTLYSPLKIFLPISLMFFMAGMFYYAYTFFSQGRFTNMSALLFSTSVLIFLIGLVSEQITSIMYNDRGNK